MIEQLEERLYAIADMLSATGVTNPDAVPEVQLAQLLDEYVETCRRAKQYRAVIMES